jgi:glutathione synthase/RimK-type ligase-like ATP-grasp enzyme
MGRVRSGEPAIAMKTVLILSSTSDFHSDLLVKAADTRGMRCLRWNTDHERVTAEVDSSLPNDALFITSQQEVRASDIDLAFIRRPTRACVAANQVWQSEVRDDEWQAFEHGLIHLSHARNVNPTASAVAARNKLLQLKVAHACGLSVPETVISTRLERLIAFAETGDVVTKAVSYGGVTDGDHVRTGYTRAVTVEEIRALETAPAPTLLQRHIRPAAMWRVVTIGDQVFSFRLRGQELNDVTDSRFVETQLKGGHIPTPTRIEAGMREMLHRLSISYASSDFIEDASGELFFLDLNPDGQWAHYELEFGVPLSEHLIDLPTIPQPMALGGVNPSPHAFWRGDQARRGASR